jgi:hypothetical protein
MGARNVFCHDGDGTGGELWLWIDRDSVKERAIRKVAG